MSSPNPTDPKSVPQFATAEYAAKTSDEVCKSCNHPITGRYYRVDGALMCETCAEISRRQLPADSHSSFVRGIIFGIGGAILGLVIYATFGIVTGLVIGYLSLAVGYIVGKAIHMGSRGAGGRRYQIAAVLLTYAAVSLSAIPIAISEARKQAALERAAAGENPGSASRAQVAADSAETNPDAPAPAESASKRSFGAAIGWLALIGLASPFLDLQDPIHGLIGLVILSVGIRIAWRLTAGSEMQVLGPFEANVPARPPGA